jgi:hypothetical protein
MKPKDFEEWFDRGGARHLRHRHAESSGAEPELPANDVMQWANG